jgi:hypothetical protein
MACEHRNFQTNAKVSRIVDDEAWPSPAYHCDLTVTCADCGEAFIFLGMPAGSDLLEATVSWLGEEARLPLRPASEYYASCGHMLKALKEKVS